MFCVPSPVFRRLAGFTSGLLTAGLLLGCLVLTALAVTQDSGTSGSAQASGTSGSAQAAPQEETKTSANVIGTQTYTRTLQTERKVTSDGEVEIQRYRAPAWQGDDNVVWEREVRTRKLPDGTVERETTVRSPDGANRMQPVQVIRETIKKAADTTTTERDVLQPNYDGHWQPVQKETVVNKKVGNAEHTVEEVQVPNLAGDWHVIDRQTTSTRSSGGDTVIHAVRQRPGSSGELTDYEIRDERTVKQGDKETHETTLRRRDASDAEGRRFFLVDHTTEAATTTGGITVRRSTTESDFISDGAIPNPSGHTEVVEQCTQQETAMPSGSKQIVTNCKQRDPGDPSSFHAVPTIVQQKDRNGQVRQILLPAQ